MRVPLLVAATFLALSAVRPASAAEGPLLRIERGTERPRTMLERVGATFTSVLPLVAERARGGLKLTTAIGGPASRERLEGRLETRTTLVSPQVGCWLRRSQGFFMGLELGWAVASSAPARSESGAGLSGMARPTASLLQLGWTR